jgi:hypothetical protein
LYIDETMALYTGELHVNCNKPLLTEDKLAKLAESNGFKYVNSVTVVWHKKKPVRKIFAFEMKG